MTKTEESTLEQRIVDWGRKLGGAEQTLLDQDLEIGNIRATWQAEGGKGNFSKVVQQLLQTAGAPVPSHGKVQVMLRSAEAQRAGLRVRDRTEAAAAGTLLRKALKDGQPLAVAVPSVQEVLDAGAAQEKAARLYAGEEDNGLARVTVPELFKQALLSQVDRLCTLATEVGHQDVPTEGPERLAFVVQILEAGDDDHWRHFLTEAL